MRVSFPYFSQQMSLQNLPPVIMSGETARKLQEIIPHEDSPFFNSNDSSGRSVKRSRGGSKKQVA
jgi:hypothetical protein